MASFLASPLGQSLSTMVIKETLAAILGKKNDKADHHKEIETLKNQVEELTREKEERNATLIKEKEEECARTAQRNMQLQNKVAALESKLQEKQLAGDKSSEMLKEKLDEIKSLQHEIHEVKELKGKKEKEIEQIKSGYEKQKNNIRDVNQLVSLLAKVGGKIDSSEASTSAGLSEAEILALIPTLLDRCCLEEEKTKEQDKKKKKKNTPKSSDTSGKPPALPNNSPSQQKMNTGNPPPSPGPPNNASQNLVGQPIVLPQSNASGHFMGPHHSNFMPPPNPYTHPPPYSAPHPFTPQHPFPLQNSYPPQHNYSPNPQYFPQPPNPPPLMSGSCGYIPSAPPPYNSNNFTNKGRTIPVTLTNNLGKKGKIQNSDNTNKNKMKDEPKGDKGCDSKKKEIKDLWSQLEDLKTKIAEKKSDKSQLNKEISTLMMDSADSSVTSKDKFMKELSECFQSVTNLPENDAAGYSKNTRPQGREQQSSNREGYSRYFKSTSNQPDNRKFDSENDEVSFICSEPAQRNPFRGYYHNNYQNRGNFSGNRGRDQQFKRGYSRNFKTSSKQMSNRKSDDESCSDNDDVSSLCSEPAARFNRGGYRGRGRGRGNWNSGRGGRGSYHRNSRSTDALNIEVGTEAVEGKTFRKGSSRNKNVDNAQRGKQGAGSSRGSTSHEQKEPDLINFDDIEEQPTKDAAYASQKIMKKLINEPIPSLIDAIMSQIDVTLKVKGYVMVATKDGCVIKEDPQNILDIIQFKRNYPDACLFKE